MKARTLGRFVAKGYTPILYTWTPDTTFTKKLPNIQNSVENNPVKRFCTAIPGSQGEDYTTDYVYDIKINAQGNTERLAYVECDYVK